MTKYPENIDDPTSLPNVVPQQEGPIVGPPGPQGAPGPRGIPGPPGASGGSPSNVVVYQQGAVPSGNIYNSWATAYAAAQLVSGPKTIAVDTSLGSATVPAGTYDFTYTKLLGIQANGAILSPVLSLVDGVTFTNAVYFENIEVDSNNTTVPVVSLSSGTTTVILRNALIQPQASQPFWNINSSTLIIDLFDGGQLNVNSVTITGTAFLVANATGASLVQSGSVTGTTGGLTINFDDSSTVGVSGFTGTITLNPLSLANQVFYNPATPGNWSPAPTLVAPALDQLAARSGGGSPTGPAGGDLSGTYPNPNVVGIQAVAVSGTVPTTGQVLTATSPTAAHWQTPSSGGFTAGGDLSGSGSSQTVIGIQNHAVPTPSGTNTFLEWTGSSFTWAAGGGGGSNYATPPTVGVLALQDNLGGNYNANFSNSLINPLLSTFGSVPITISTGLLSYVAADNTTYVIPTSSGNQNFGPSIWLARANVLIRYDETSGGGMTQVPLDDIGPSGLNNIFDLSFGNNKIWVLEAAAIARINIIPFQYGVEKIISVSNISFTGTSHFDLGGFTEYDNVNNRLIVYPGQQNQGTIYDVDANLTTATPHIIDTTGVTGFTFFPPGMGGSAPLRGKLANGFLYMGAIGSGNTLWILKIDPATFATTASLNTGAVIAPSGIYQNIAYSPVNNFIFIPTQSGIVRIDLTTFTVNQTLSTTPFAPTSRGHCITVDDTNATQQLAITDTNNINIYQVIGIDTTMTVGTSLPITVPPGYFNPYTSGPIVFYPTAGGAEGAFLFTDTDNNLVLEAHISGGVPAIDKSFGVGAGTIWQPANILNTNPSLQSIQAGPYNISFNESFIPCDTTGGSFTVNLPNNQAVTGLNPFPYMGAFYVILDVNGSFAGNNLTVSGNGNNIWFGGTSHASITLNTNGQSVVFYCFNNGNFSTPLWIAK